MIPEDAPSPTREAVDIPTQERPLVLLKFFTPKQPTWTLTQLARASGLPKASCLRVLRVLEKYEFLQRDCDLYRLWMGALTLGTYAQHHAPPRNTALPHLERLRGQVAHTISWAVLDGDECVYVEVLPAARDQKEAVHPGLRVPLLADPSARILLAFAPRDVRQAVFRSGTGTVEGAMPSRTMPLIETLDSVARKTWLAGPFPAEKGTLQFAAPVFRANGSLVAALGMVCAAAPDISWPEYKTELDALNIAARKISQGFGYEREWSGDPEFFLQILQSMPMLSILQP